MKIKTAFLNGELDEEIYIQQPVGFVVPGKENNMFKLQRSIYDLKQSSRQFHFPKTVTSYGFTLIL